MTLPIPTVSGRPLQAPEPTLVERKGRVRRRDACRPFTLLSLAEDARDPEGGASTIRAQRPFRRRGGLSLGERVARVDAV